MDFTEATKVVYDRIQMLEPENVSKIIGYLLLQDHGEREMIRLAFGPDNMILSLIHKAKIELGLSMSPVSAPISPSQMKQSPFADLQLHHLQPYPPSSMRVVSSPAATQFWDAQVSADQQPVPGVDFVAPVFSDLASEDYHLRSQMRFLSLEDQLESANGVSSDFSSNYFFPEPALSIRTSRRSPSLPEFPVKVCQYFNKGFCKHGNNCRYFHGHPTADNISQIMCQGSNEILNEDHVVSPGSLEKLEAEITELLKSKRGVPVSIASLPMLYYEKYGRVLQADGYLTESQRHGKAGFSLTKLLARLKNSIRLIDRPHGQHSVILADDLPKYLEYASERADAPGTVSGSRQIYLTFPADSTFTEQDVSSYFNKFGPVQDVRIPCQQKRMFGFVTFAFAETVQQILAKGNPHFVCGARVLVKPYREKSRLVERKCAEKHHHHMHYGQTWDPEMHSVQRLCDNSRYLRKHLAEEHEQALECERRHLSEMQLTPKTLSHYHPFFGFVVDDLKLSEACHEQAELPAAERIGYLFDTFNDSSSSEVKLRHVNTTSYSEQQDNSTQGVNLPDSPFASSIGSGISTVI